MSMDVETTRIAQWRMQRDVKVAMIKLHWAEIQKTQEQYAYLGANDSETDRLLQGIVYGISCEIPVTIPKSPKQYLLSVNSSDIEEIEQLKQCAQVFHQVLREIKKEWKWFDHQPIPETLTEFLKEKCWRFH
jgi:hypothetical protein